MDVIAVQEVGAVARCRAADSAVRNHVRFDELELIVSALRLVRACEPLKVAQAPPVESIEIIVHGNQVGFVHIPGALEPELLHARGDGVLAVVPRAGLRLVAPERVVGAVDAAYRAGARGRTHLSRHPYYLLPAVRGAVAVQVGREAVNHGLLGVPDARAEQVDKRLLPGIFYLLKPGNRHRDRDLLPVVDSAGEDLGRLDVQRLVATEKLVYVEFSAYSSS